MRQLFFIIAGQYPIMTINQELEEILQKRSQEISSVEITYINGGKAKGPIRKLKTSPLKLVIQKISENGKKSGKHMVVFEHATDCTITFMDGIKKNFN